MKNKALVKQFMRQFYSMVLISCVISILQCLLLIIYNGIHLSVFNNVFYSFPVVLFLVSMIVMSFNYSHFKMGMQMGITRSNLFKAKLLFIVKISLVINGIMIIFDVLNLIFHNSWSNSFFYHYFGFFHNTFVDSIAMFITNWLILLCIFMVLNTFGSFVALFNRIGKFIFYIIMAFIYLSLASLLSRDSSYFVIAHFLDHYHIKNFVYIILGFGSKGQLTIANPLYLMGTLLVVTALASLFNYAFTRFSQVKR